MLCPEHDWRVAQACTEEVLHLGGKRWYITPIKNFEEMKFPAGILHSARSKEGKRTPWHSSRSRASSPLYPVRTWVASPSQGQARCLCTRCPSSYSAWNNRSSCLPPSMRSSVDSSYHVALLGAGLADPWHPGILLSLDVKEWFTLQCCAVSRSTKEQTEIIWPCTCDSSHSWVLHGFATDDDGHLDVCH